MWVDGKLLINNSGEVKRFSRRDTSMALAKGMHAIKLVFLEHVIGGWPSDWSGGSLRIRKSDADEFMEISGDMLFTYKEGGISKK